MKQCTRCGRILPLEEFGKDRQRSDGIAYYCRACNRASSAERYLHQARAAGILPRQTLTPEERRQKRQAWEATRKPDLAAYQRQYRQENKADLQVKKRAYYRRVQAEGVREYGGRCTCCGESDARFLTLDHINGRADEAHRVTGVKAWSRLKRLGWPRDNYQLLCFNCNCAKGIYGVCPHATG